MTATAVTPLEALRTRMSTLLAERLPEHIGRLGWDPARLRAHQTEALRALLARAVEASPFHARRLGGIDPATFELEDLARLPVMTKPDLMGSFDEVVTDRRLTRARVEEHLEASAREPSLLLDEYVCLASGGSSGVRGVFVQRLDEYVELGAAIMRRTFARLAVPGEPPPAGPLVLALVTAAAPVHSTGFSAAASRDGAVRIESVPATLPLDEIVARLNALMPPMVMGFATRLAALAREQAAGRLRIAPVAISATSETLTAEDRAAIQEAFGVPLVNQFAATEGLVGATEPGEELLTFATDICLVEPVDDDGRPVAPGRPSTRVLVTNLHNLTQPLIRYELTDRFALGSPHPVTGMLQATVEGRADEVLRYGDVGVHPLVLRSVFVKTPAVSEYQVRQTPTGVEADVVAEGSLDEAQLAAGLAGALRAAGVDGATASVRFVGSIARNPQSGKARRFIPL